MSNKGVTLIELLIVIGIIGVLAAIAIPGYVGQQRRAARSEAQVNLENIRLIEEQSYAENGEYPTGTLGTCAKDNDGNVGTIQAQFSGFRPGNELSYSYCIQGGKLINTTSNTIEDVPPDIDCFVAQAFGNTNSRVNGEQFWLDCFNNWHYIQ